MPNDSRLTRRDLLAGTAAAGAAMLLHGCGDRGSLGLATSGADSLALCSAPGAGSPPGDAADYTLRIATGLVELAPEHIISTTLYNGQFPGPLLRFKEGKPAVVDVFNDTDTPEQLHWHGQFLPVYVDGSAEEGTPFIPAHGKRRLAFTPSPAGFRFYHTHVIPRDNLNAGQYSGQVGPVYIEPRHDPGAFDQEVFLVLKEFQPVLSRGGDMDLDFLAGEEVAELKSAGESEMKAARDKGMPKGFEVGYSLFSINGRMLGHGDPIQVKQGQRVLFHILNGSATENRSLALPKHTFKVVALDGNPVPTPAEVPVLWIGTAERVSAIVEMKEPGVWVLGDLDDDDRGRGMGIVVEYAGKTGKPQWSPPPKAKWDYTRFALSKPPAHQPDEIIEMTFAKQNAAEHGFNRWTINGTPFSMAKMQPNFKLVHGKRYRWRMRNATDDIHPMHVHRLSFELTKFAGKPTSGLIKDVIMLGGYQELEVDFTADQLGAILFHCHMQIHMDFGFMGIFNCA